MEYFETRIPPLLVTGVLMLIIYLINPQPTQELWLQIVSAGLGIGAVLLGRLSITRFLINKTTLSPLTPEKTLSLVTDGIFSVSRNPMYLAMVLLITAWALYFMEIFGLIFSVVGVLYLTQFQIKPEEKSLEIIFGEEFILYKSRVRRWI